MGTVTPGSPGVRDRKRLEHSFPCIFLCRCEKLQTIKCSYIRGLKKKLIMASELCSQDIIHTRQSFLKILTSCCLQFCVFFLFHYQIPWLLLPIKQQCPAEKKNILAAYKASILLSFPHPLKEACLPDTIHSQHNLAKKA